MKKLKLKQPQKLSQKLSQNLSNIPFLVVGLGNPGPDYSHTRHNIGRMVLTKIAADKGLKFNQVKQGAQLAKFNHTNGAVLLAAPSSFMNLSGNATGALAKFYKIPADQVLVIHDELDLDFATVRFKAGGGHGGHNGLRSITAQLGPDYLRLRVGIGRPPGSQDPANFVLGRFSSVEQKELGTIVATAADAVIEFLDHGLSWVQQRYHTAN